MIVGSLLCAAGVFLPQEVDVSRLPENERAQLAGDLAEWLKARQEYEMAPSRLREATGRVEKETHAAFLDRWDGVSGSRGDLLSLTADLRAMFETAFPYLERAGNGRVEPLAGEFGAFPAERLVPVAYTAERSWRTVLVLPGREGDRWAEPEEYLRTAWAGASVQGDSLYFLPALSGEMRLEAGESSPSDLRLLQMVLQPFGVFLRQYRVDRERVFLDCGRGACAFGLRMCTWFPDRFAGLVLRWPEKVPDLRLGSLTGLSVALLESPQTRDACRALQRRLEAQGTQCVVVRVTGEPPFPAALPELDRWMQGVRRNSFQRRVVLEPNDARFKKGYWVAIGTMDPEANPRIEVVADRADNRITIEARGVTAVRLSLNDDLVDLDREITVVANGSTSRHRPVRSLDRMIQTAWQRFDPTMLFPASLALEIAAAGGRQDPFETFDAAYARSAWSEAVQAFLQVPRSAVGYTERLGRAGIAAQRAGQHELALELLAENAEAGGETAATLQVRLEALAARDDLEGLITLARASAGAFAETVQNVLVGHETRLLPFADGLLRQRRTAAGLWVFESLAATDEGWRLANLALAYRKVGRVADSAAAYRHAIEASPRDEQIRNDYGLFLRATGHWTEAADVLWQSHALDAEPGQGPAITNLVQMELLRPGTPGRDPLPAAARALALRPDAEMLRRLVLDLVLMRQEGEDAPDKGLTGR